MLSSSTTPSRINASRALSSVTSKAGATDASAWSVPFHRFTSWPPYFHDRSSSAAELTMRCSRSRSRRAVSYTHLDVYKRQELDLRLAAVLPGSSRLVITSAAHRDLLDDGIAKSSLDRVFRVLESGGQGQEFLEAITDLGPSSARRLRDLLHLIVSSAAELDL